MCAGFTCMANLTVQERSFGLPSSTPLARLLLGERFLPRRFRSQRPQVGGAGSGGERGAKRPRIEPPKALIFPISSYLSGNCVFLLKWGNKRKIKKKTIEHPHPTDDTTDWQFSRGVPVHITTHECSIQASRRSMGSHNRLVLRS